MCIFQGRACIHLALLRFGIVLCYMEQELMKLTDTYDLAGIHYLVMTLQLILAGKSTLHCMP